MHDCMYEPDPKFPSKMVQNFFQAFYLKTTRLCWKQKIDVQPQLLNDYNSSLFINQQQQTKIVVTGIVLSRHNNLLYIAHATHSRLRQHMHHSCV